MFPDSLKRCFTNIYIYITYFLFYIFNDGFLAIFVEVART